ncbi:hypothetical protein TWF569_000844 [Orbilia oligospora]|uniref:Hypervirulence associated protein TUDOR domain-containing protein n=1 Tax=Orbilia oligospora TaxID=2813651 RepID=A0A4Z0Y2H0_ORBOL|nr:hypothetical protein TWF103_003625 [Orbilia oligospora]KAF3082387.1 hypothetical protein TWF102_001227 [Orbilia oligospora]KAF3089905.1 hypothetical protein TWF706_010288 [Orbilia oligospora]KAF3089906.1 hypothetical protein TWF706_010288 [Orbilia oligospora]KAF3125402.1 hypothetical protein TWF569_000844 [Orbilia oligospora]
MAFSEGTHVTFTNSTGGEEVGVVQSHSGGQYTIQRKNGSTVTVSESSVKELKVTSGQKDNCPVVGTA